MPSRSLYASGLLVLAIATLSARTAAAQTVAAGPYYAIPSWDQTFACATPDKCRRFIVLSNFGSQAVMDRETGLVWERSPSAASFTWFSASVGCMNLRVGNRFGWRLPTFPELRSLVDATADFLPAGHPFSGVQSERYWSATGPVESPESAFGVALRAPGFGHLPRTEKLLRWCVRGGQGVGAQ
jgi:hypothetical protein